MFFVGFTPSVQDFCVIIHEHLNALVSGYLDLRFLNFTPFLIKNLQYVSKIWKKWQIVKF